jgi:hypothetical protein
MAFATVGRLRRGMMRLSRQTRRWLLGAVVAIGAATDPCGRAVWATDAGEGHGGPPTTPGRSGAASGACRIVWGRPVADVPLTDTVRLGGLSDLSSARSGGPDHWWAITDRGPNGTVERAGSKFRTLLVPGFTPSLVLLQVECGGRGAAEMNQIAVKRVVPLSGLDGKALTGLPTGGPGHLPVLSADGSTELSPDPDGVDTEGVVEMPDGTLWIAEEYGPSLLKIGADGRAIERHVPVGTGNTAAAVPHRVTIPAAYGLRHDNRGFEAIAASPDGTRLWVLLQSPLDNPGPKAAKKTGNVRLLGFDPVAGKPAAEHLYRLGDPTDPDYLAKGAPPDDGKLCAMAMLDDSRLLVLEQDDAGLARLYAVSLAGATDTLAWQPSSGDFKMVDKTLEELRDLPKAGIVPVGKRLVADLGTLREAMTAQADGGRPLHGPLKLEGLAIVDDWHVLLANDDDFGVHGKQDSPRRSFLWLVELDRPLGAIPPR